MFGVYNSTFSHESGVLKLKIERDGGVIRYRRESREGQVEKLLASLSGSVIISPVEPVNLPTEVAKYLQIEFPPLIIGPKESQTVYLTFPLEIGVFLATRDSHEVIDVFSYERAKYTLYGSPRSGVICRWHASRIHTEVPKADPLREGVLELHVSNEAETWAEVACAVFTAFGIRLYYDGRFVSMVARMTILSRLVAETVSLDRPLCPGMTKGIELYRERTMLPGMERIPGMEKDKFLMEWGLK
ncbi:MAG: DUF432 domain-containing protein [Methanomicrobiales archaeon]|nr:DUF432 domain-containing protein [Methanomicrobiales archaeon]